jgi:hypothetical protein
LVSAFLASRLPKFTMSIKPWKRLFVHSPRGSLERPVGRE